jgi:hypothetical protein
MSMECERVFLSAKKLLTPARDNLQEDIIEATECLKVWWDEEIIQQRGEGSSEGRAPARYTASSSYSGSQDTYNTLAPLTPSFLRLSGTLLPRDD